MPSSRFKKLTSTYERKMAQQAKLNSTVDGIVPLFFLLNDGIRPQSINQTHRYSGQDIQPDLICNVRFLNCVNGENHKQLGHPLFLYEKMIKYKKIHNNK